MSTIELEQVSDEQQTAGPSDAAVAQPEPSNSYQNFDYHPVTPFAPLALFFGLCSLATFLVWQAASIALIGTIMGAMALWKIRRSGGEVGGRAIALPGFVLAFVSLFGGSSYQAYAYVMEVPEGHERVSFSWMSKRKPQITVDSLKIHPEVASLDGKNIYIKGFMYPTRNSEGITDFVLVKDSGACCFGGNPPPSDMISIHLEGGLSTHMRTQIEPVGVGGVFHVGTPEKADGGLVPIYSMEGFHIR